MRAKRQPYLGQVFVSDQRHHFIYVGDGKYVSTGGIGDEAFVRTEDDLDLAALPDNYRIYETVQP